MRQITIADWMLWPRRTRSVCHIAITDRLCHQTYYKKIISRTALHEVLRTIFGTITRHFSQKFAAALGRREHNFFNIFLTLLYKFIEIYLKYKMKQQYSLDIFIYLTLIYKFIETNLNLFLTFQLNTLITPNV